MGALLEGICNICAEFKTLDKEHVPPQAAFNDNKFVMATADEYWGNVQSGIKIKKRINQGGHGVYTICKRCNNDTGGWYGKSFVKWSRQGMEFLEKTGGKGSDLYFSDIRPLPIIKQIITMFLALAGNDPSFREKNFGLFRFVINTELKYLDPMYRIWVYFVAPGPLRMTPFSTVMQLEGRQNVTGMEISYPPFGYMLTFNSIPLDRRLIELTGFTRYSFHERDMIKLHMSVLPTHGPMMGDFRCFRPLPTPKKDETRYILEM